MVVEDKYKFNEAEKLKFMLRIEKEIKETFHSAHPAKIIHKWYKIKNELMLEYIRRSIRLDERKKIGSY